MPLRTNDNLDDLPDLPPLRTPFSSNSSIPSVTEIEGEEIHNLPSFPDSPAHNSFSQAVIKEAVSDRHDTGENVLEMREWTPTKFKDSQGARQPDQSKDFLTNSDYVERNNFNKPIVRNRGDMNKGPDVFVKIDKFYSAKKTISDVKAKLEEIDSLINKVREVKLREEQELSSWEREFNDIKTRLKEVTENIFERVE
ncbi:MAG: hypothetical protein AABY10_02220 [Nanoarchaeota archaeon]